ncbi:hypothetical protein LOTGIDRAFT_229651 [Lottia gigantea]|uniref:Peroxisomal 2,4-dienoyl-CoA reductase [(3E)-enoyl-CoA-producing] n=1 Tax=Lottia gigantea TaxID=225164 RepID=V3ZTF1_LOTGI|nr:hypothetical protein LOTGIDRAFT_229651 [Lottia gigantea]ESO84186.1 hypothetical protein LOTGIDRAFT_229651 [Lottia gigantea]
MSAGEKVFVEKCLNSYKQLFVPDLLRDKVVFVTGGGSGICFTITEVFLRHGCKGVIVGRNLDRLKKSTETLTKATGQRCLSYQVDVKKPQDILNAIDETLKEFGRIDYLINGAAGNFLCPLESMSYNAFKTVMEIDTMGTLNTSKAVFDRYFKNNGGVIINITATLHFRGQALQAHAGSAKAAIEALTRHMAVEWGGNNVRVMCVAPGPIGNTEGMRRLSPGDPMARDLARYIPIGRIGERVEIGNICLYLVSGMADLLTGTTIVADGGAWLIGSNDFTASKRMYDLAVKARAKL